MSIEMKQSLKQSLQLVMTPQLQQAIKLLQLSRMELVDVVHEEMMENPVLEDEADASQEKSNEREAFDVDGRSDATRAATGETEVAGAEPGKSEKTGEIKLGDHAVNEIDWGNYLD